VCGLRLRGYPMAKFEKILDKIMRFLMAAAMFSLVAGGFWQIFTRWILKDPSTVTEEFMRYMLIWASMLGSAYCFYKDKHLTLDLFSSKAKGAAGVIVNVFIEAVILFFVIYVFVYGGMHLVITSINKSPVMQIPYKVLYFILPFSGIFIVIARVLKYVQLFSDRKNKDVA
jgi:TRAP-type transport system small permease protein